MPAAVPPPVVPPIRFGAYGGTTSVFVAAADHVTWTARLSAGAAGWLTLSGGAAGTGCGLVTLAAARNLGAQHTTQLAVVDAAGRSLLDYLVTQISAEPLATLNQSVLAVPFLTTPRVMELGIAGNWVAQQIQKIPEPFDVVALALVEAIIVALGALATLLRGALSVAVPEPLTWLGAPPPWTAMTETAPATAVCIAEETTLLALYVAENAFGSE